MCPAVFHQWLHVYCPLKHQLSPACRRNTYLWRHSTNNSSTVSNRNCEVSISPAADNAILKNRAQNRECSFGCVTRSAVLLIPNVADILLFNFYELNSFNMTRSPLTVKPSPCSFSKKNFPIMPLDQNPHQTVVRFGCVGQWMRESFLYPKCYNFACLHTRQDQNELHLKNDFFLLAKSAFSVSRSQAHFPALFKRIHNHIRLAEG